MAPTLDPRPLDPRALVVAHLAVVRHVAALLTARDVTASQPIEAALALVARWATEGGIDGDALAAAAEAAWADGHPHRLASEPALRARMWLGTAAGNLASMARRERGWKDAPRTILDAAASALSSLRTEGLPDRATLEALAAEALAAVPPAPARKKTKGPPRPKRLGPTPELGALASAYLARRRPSRDPRATADPATLTALLEARGLPVGEAALAFEARYGGTRFAETGRAEGADFVLGPYALLKDDDATPGAARGLVPIALSPSDVWYFVDATGTAWAQDAIEDPAPVPYATTATIALARLLLYARAFDERHAGSLELEGPRGAELAARLGLPGIAEASDLHARFWGDARTLVIEHEVESEPATLAVGRGVKKLEPLV